MRDRKTDTHIARVIAGTVLTLGVLYLLLDFMADGLIFQPTPGADLSPEALGIDGESVYLTTSDAVRIHAYYLPGRTPSGAEKRAVLFLHGNAGNASHRLPNAAELANLGSAVLLLDYRGYGFSEGRPSESGSYLDARAGLAELNRRGFSNQRVAVFGRSLGGAIAVDLAAEFELAGVILESTFSSIADVAREIGGPLMAFLAGSRFDSISKISQVASPLLFFHGDLDRVIDHRLGRRLFEAAPEPKAFETISGAGHNDTVLVGGRPYFERIARFLDQVAPDH